MNRGEKIEIEIAPDGVVQVEGHGFSGPDCGEAMKFVEVALGGTVTGRNHKPEFWRRVRSAVQRVGGRG